MEKWGGYKQKFMGLIGAGMDKFWQMPFLALPVAVMDDSENQAQIH